MVFRIELLSSVGTGQPDTVWYATKLSIHPEGVEALGQNGVNVLLKSANIRRIILEPAR